MISSKALLDQTGMSRATLNNYIQLGILPKPVVMSQSGDSSESGARLLGYFPPDALARVRAVQSLKGEGLSMAEIAEYIAENGPLPESEAGSASDFAYQPPEAQATPKPNMFAEGTVNDTDALALGQLLAGAGGSLALAYVRHAVEADPAREAQAQAYALVDAIHFTGAQARRDIGYRAIERETAPR